MDTLENEKGRQAPQATINRSTFVEKKGSINADGDNNADGENNAE